MLAVVRCDNKGSLSVWDSDDFSVEVVKDTDLIKYMRVTKDHVEGVPFIDDIINSSIHYSIRATHGNVSINNAVVFANPWYMGRHCSYNKSFNNINYIESKDSMIFSNDGFKSRLKIYFRGYSFDIVLSNKFEMIPVVSNNMLILKRSSRSSRGLQRFYNLFSISVKRDNAILVPRIDGITVVSQTKCSLSQFKASILLG